MTKKNLISLAVAFAFLSLSISGLFLYVGKKPHFVETIHVIFGLTFITVAVVHIINNWASLVTYTKGASGTVRKEFVIVAVFFLVFLTGAGLEIPPFSNLTEAGKNLLRGDEKRERRPERLSFDEISTNKDRGATRLSILIRRPGNDKSKFVIWAVQDGKHPGEGLFAAADTEPSLYKEWATAVPTTAPNYEKEMPGGNFILATAVSFAGSFSVHLQTSDGKQYMAMIPADHHGVYKMQTEETGTLNAIIELN